MPIITKDIATCLYLINNKEGLTFLDIKQFLL